jgi:hypothetical protein
MFGTQIKKKLKTIFCDPYIKLEKVKTKIRLFSISGGSVPYTGERVGMRPN